MWAFHVSHANQLRLLFTDTDSLAYAVQTDDIYGDMADDAADRYDFRIFLSTIFFMIHLIVKHLDSS